MTTRTDDRPSAAGGAARGALPGAPTRAYHEAGPAVRAQSQEEALTALVREDLSPWRAMSFVAAAAMLALVAVATPVLVQDLVHSEASEAGPAAAALLALLALLGVPPLWVLHNGRRRSEQRFALMRSWAAADRTTEPAILDRYGLAGPHPRFFWASPVCIVALLLIGLMVFVPDALEPELLWFLVAVTLLSGSVVRKFWVRRAWSGREKAHRSRRRRREQGRESLAAEAARAAAQASTKGLPQGDGDAPPRTVRVPPGAWLVPLLVAYAVVVRPWQGRDSLPAAILYGTVLLVVLLVAYGVKWSSGRRLRAVAGRLTPAFPGDVPVHPVRFGLADPEPEPELGYVPEPGTGGNGVTAWDRGPQRAGALAVGAGFLRLRGDDGAALDLPLAEVSGAVLIRAEALWAADAVDVLFRSGEAVEVRAPGAGELLDAFAGEGVPVGTGR